MKVPNLLNWQVVDKTKESSLGTLNFDRYYGEKYVVRWEQYTEWIMMVKTQTVFRNGLEMDSRETSTLDEEERDQFNRLWNQNWTKKAK